MKIFPLSDFLLPGYLPLNRLNIVVLIFIRAFEKITIVKKLEFFVLAISQKETVEIEIKLMGKSNAFSFQIFSRKGITTPSVKRRVKRHVKRQRQRHQCKSMVTLHLTLQMGPRSIT